MKTSVADTKSDKIINSVNIKPKNKTIDYMMKNSSLYIMLIPVIVYLIVFKYLPMFGIIIAFKDFNLVKGILKSDWVGLKYFEALFFNSPAFLVALKNSLILSFMQLIWGFPAPIFLALMLNEVYKDKFKRVIQTVVYLPHFISWVVISGIVINFLSPTDGLLNYIIMNVFGGSAVPYLQKPEYFRTIIVVSSIWKEAGWGTIIYLAAISGIDTTIYEAAIIDGANRFQRIIYITLPAIMSTVVVLLILRLGSLLSNGFEQIFLLYSPLTYETADVIETFTYRLGIQSGQYSYSAAAGLFNSLIGFILIISSNILSKKFNEKSIW